MNSSSRPLPEAGTLPGGTVVISGGGGGDVTVSLVAGNFSTGRLADGASGMFDWPGGRRGRRLLGQGKTGRQRQQQRRHSRPMRFYCDVSLSFIIIFPS